MICIINGAPQAGKDTFCELVQNFMDDNLCYNLSSIDLPKKMALLCGWDGVKNNDSRKFLSDLKDLITQFNDAPFNYIIKQVKDIKCKMKYYSISEDKYIVFIHIREPEEIKKVVAALNAQVLLIRRAAAEIQKVSNHADAEVLNYSYDYIIENNGTIEELQQKAQIFIKNLASKYKEK